MTHNTLAELRRITWRDWLDTVLRLAAAAVIVASIALICIGFAPDLNP